MRVNEPLVSIVLLAIVGGCRSAPGPEEDERMVSSSDLSLVATANAAPPPATLSPARGGEIGLSFESYLSPHQEPAEESATPRGTPAMFRSTAPSVSRNEREAAGHRGHGTLRFTRDLSRAFVDVKIEGVTVDTINMFHIHCGKPGILGPILVDFSHSTDIVENFSGGAFSVEVTNADLVQTSEHGHGVVAAFANGCVIPSPSLSGVKPSKVSTVAGMALLAAENELYFNLHTKGQTFYGDLRGQILAVE